MGETRGGQASHNISIPSVSQFSCSVGSNSLNSVDRSTPGLPVHHQLLELTQTHVCWVSDAIQPSHPLLSPSPPAFNLSQPQGFSNESVLLCSVFFIVQLSHPYMTTGKTTALTRWTFVALAGCSLFIVYYLSTYIGPVFSTESTLVNRTDKSTFSCGSYICELIILPFY